MARQATQTISDTAAFGNTWTDVQTIGLNPRELCHVQIKADNQSGTVTDAMEVRVLASSDDGTTFDDTPILAFSFLPSAITAEYKSFSLHGVYKDQKIQARSAGVTDNYIAGGFYRLDGVSA